jgi:ribosomal protein S27E
MPKPLPDCPQCESPQLQVSRADARGAKWAQCAACGTVILLRADNTVAHVSAPTSASRSAS